MTPHRTTDPAWDHLAPRIATATAIDILASFVQLSGLDLIQEALFRGVRSGSTVRRPR